jgi:hypothetical protein
MDNTLQNLTVKQLDARIIEARMWLKSDSPLPWGEVGGDWCPEATAALTTSEEQVNIGTEDEDLASDLEWDAHWAAFDDEE